jgi:hypothetical protein
MENRRSCKAAFKNIIYVLLILFSIMSIAASAWLFSHIVRDRKLDLIGYNSI